jgi:hypothetical protein
MNRTYVSLDLAFVNLGIAIYQRGRLYVYRIRWSDGVPDALDVGDAFASRFLPRFGAVLQEADFVVLEKPFLRSRSRSSSIGGPLLALYNCITAVWGGKCWGYSPSIKKTLYSFDTSDKVAITGWAGEVLTGLAREGIVPPATLSAFNRERKADDMADALFLLTHHIRSMGGLQGLTQQNFRRPEYAIAAWKTSINNSATLGSSAEPAASGSPSALPPTCLNTLLIASLESMTSVVYSVVYTPTPWSTLLLTKTELED